MNNYYLMEQLDNMRDESNNKSCSATTQYKKEFERGYRKALHDILILIQKDECNKLKAIKERIETNGGVVNEIDIEKFYNE